MDSPSSSGLMHLQESYIDALSHKAPPIICSRRQYQMLLLFHINKYGMIFHENRLLILMI